MSAKCGCKTDCNDQISFILLVSLISSQFGMVSQGDEASTIQRNGCGRSLGKQYSTYMGKLWATFTCFWRIMGCSFFFLTTCGKEEEEEEEITSFQPHQAD
jgi:hypothetical protein